MPLTRDGFQPQYSSTLQPWVNLPGSMVTRQVGAPNSNKLITVVMPTARPNSSPAPEGAPFYLSGPNGGSSYRPNGVFGRGGAMTFGPRRPRVEMDPSDNTTWQRSYRFT